MSQDQTLRERLASHPRSTRTRDRGSSVKRRVRQPGSAPYTGAEVTSLGSPSRSRAEACELERSVVEPGRDPKRTAARQTTSPSSERTCCLVFKDREPLGSCWTVSAQKRPLTERPPSARWAARPTWLSACPSCSLPKRPLRATAHYSTGHRAFLAI